MGFSGGCCATLSRQERPRWAWTRLSALGASGGLHPQGAHHVSLHITVCERGLPTSSELLVMRHILGALGQTLSTTIQHEVRDSEGDTKVCHQEGKGRAVLLAACGQALQPPGSDSALRRGHHLFNPFPWHPSVYSLYL